ncbi:MAG TPA: HAD-IC family P-type ATPase [Methanoregulaceae archaeon]|nr:HAD-IC family P-type ATPase [Methanoregulaceae archaeon]HQJ87351.1 HAD-IC family P-type ATPase [Methanoregulaceae archaeon]
MSEQEEAIAWHAFDRTTLLERLRSGPSGLEEAEVERRLRRFGPNRLPEREPPSPLVLFLNQFQSPLIYVLILAAGISLALGDITDTVFILIVVLVNAVVGTLQEWKAEQSAHALRSLLTTTATVLRSGRAREVPAEELVPGDVILLEPGRRLPADVRLLKAQDLRIDESLLTGESIDVEKGVGEGLPDSTPVADRWTMAFAGSTVTYGRGTGIIVATGSFTQMGRIARSIAEVEGAKPPLVQRMERFAQKITFGIIVAGILLGAISFARGMPAVEVFFFVVALAVSAIPEGLPVALTVVLSVAASRMAGRSVIVRRITAVESLGSCTCVASDKTGTLTVNEQTLVMVWLPTGALFPVTGTGYRGVGTVEGLPEQNGSGEETTLLYRFGTASVLANEAELVPFGDEWRSIGDSIDIGFLAFAYKLGLDPGEVRSRIPVIHQIPYESERRYSAAIVEEDGRRRIVVKGALETLLRYCTWMETTDGPAPIDPGLVERAFDALSRDGYRVLAVAEGPVEGEWVPELPPLRLLGLAGFIDPVRPDAEEAVARCRDAGIRVVMVTGDHPSTALAIARTLGIAREEGEVVTGDELEALGSIAVPEYLDRVGNASVFARVAPLQKLEIVEGLLRLGHFVAVTGDGVNDAPALRRANIGVAMGSGTDIAKDSASMIVTDDRFSSIVAGIEEGRIAYDNVRKVTYLLIATGAAEVLLFLLSTLAGLPLPLAAIQLLWLNIVTNGIQHIGLAFEPGEPGTMQRPPRSPQEGLFDRLMLEETLLAAGTMSLVGFGAWVWLLGSGFGEDAARTMLLVLFVLFENFHVFNARSETASTFRIPLSSNRLLIASVIGAAAINAVAMYIPVLSDVLRTGPISLQAWGALAVLAMSVLIVMEIYKRFRRPSHSMG